MELCPDAVISYANYFQFGAGEEVHYPHVESRMLLWCRSGHGRIKANDVQAVMEVGQFMFLPWGHAITYTADQRNPFLIAGVHLIPRHGRERPVEFQVAHKTGDPLAGLPWRNDAELGAVEGIVQGSLEQHPSLLHLAELIVHTFLRSNPPEELARTLARLLVHELCVMSDDTGNGTCTPLPEDLQRIMSFVINHLAKPLGLEDLMEFTELSASTIGRHFKQHLGITPGEWILRKKIEQAQRLLRTTRLPVAEVGRRVGIDDPYYFSKLFKKKVGTPPLMWRRQTHRL